MSLEINKKKYIQCNGNKAIAKSKKKKNTEERKKVKKRSDSL